MKHSDNPKHEIVVLVFPEGDRAFDVQKGFKKLHREDLMELKDSVVVTRNDAGKVKVHQSDGFSAGLTSAGSVLGLIVGGLFLVPAVGGAVGAGVGALVGSALDHGLDDKFFQEIGQTIQPGTSALFLLGRNVPLDQVRESLGTILEGCTILRTTLSPEREAEVRNLLGNH